MRRRESWIALEAEALTDRIKAHRAEHAAIVEASRVAVQASRTLIERALGRAAASPEPSAPRLRDKG